MTTRKYRLMVIIGGRNVGISIDEDVERMSWIAARLLYHQLIDAFSVNVPNTASAAAMAVDATLEKTLLAALRAYEYDVADLPIGPKLDDRVKAATDDLREFINGQDT